MDLEIYTPVILEEPNEHHQVVATEERPNKRRRKKSIVWEHFTIEAAGPSRMKACCKHCKKSFAYINGPKLAGTSHLKRHISLGICTGGLHAAESTQTQTGSKTDPPKRRYRTNSGYAGVPFNQERCTGDIARMIIQHNYPLHIVEHVAFIDFVRALHPQYNMASFNTIQSECVSLYLKEKQNLLTRIGEIPGRVNLSVDLATSNLSIGYAFLTGQFIDKDWILQQRVLNVIMLPFPDSEYGFNQAVISCMSDWHLENKVFTLTVDGNEGIMRNLTSLLPVKNSVLLNGQLLKATCFARLLTRLTCDSLEKVSGPITRIRECVKYVKTSETHDEKFTELRTQLQVPSTKELAIDDQSKWNTTYLMLSAACELKEVFGCFDTADPVYKINPSADDWKEAEALCVYLKLFYEAAGFLASPSPPPANLFYHEVSKIQLELTNAASSTDAFMSDLARPMKEMFDLYWKESFLVLAIAVVMDPRFKMKLVEFSFTKMFGENAGSWIKAVDDGIHGLFVDYVSPAPMGGRTNQSDLLLPHLEGFASLDDIHHFDGQEFCEEKKYEEINQHPTFPDEIIAHDYPHPEIKDEKPDENPVEEPEAAPVEEQANAQNVESDENLQDEHKPPEFVKEEAAVEEEKPPEENEAAEVVEESGPPEEIPEAKPLESLVVETEAQQENPMKEASGEMYYGQEEGQDQNGEVNSQELPMLTGGDGLSDFEVYISAIGNQQMKSELDQYLEESLLPRVQEFDILGWWKLNKLKYPTLSKLAADVLSIPLSTVGPDSVFDTTSRKIDSYYGTLHPLTLEALICAKDWLHGVTVSASHVDVAPKIDFS